MRQRQVDELALVRDLAGELDVGDDVARRVRRVEHDGGGVRVSGLRWGDGDSGGAPMVLLHGGSLNAHAWDAMLLLAGAPAALALDLPGHGRSEWFQVPLYLPQALATVVAAVLDGDGGAPATLVGHSLGGLTALALAACRPDLVERLVLVDATPGSTPERSSALLEFVAPREFASFEDLLDHAAAFKPRRSRESLRRPVLLNARETAHGRWTWCHDGRDSPAVNRWARLFAEMPKGWDHAAAVRCPTLLVRGERSPIVLPSDVARYRSLVDDLRVIEIPGARHNIHGDDPGALHGAIASFLQETGART